jgi:ArsR family transcriptional regulator
MHAVRYAHMAHLDILLAALSHPTRREALRLLRRGNELCLCELMASTGVSQSTMSRHMTTLKEAGLVADRRDARWVRYRPGPFNDAGAAAIVFAVLDVAEDRTTASVERSAA